MFQSEPAVLGNPSISGPQHLPSGQSQLSRAEWEEEMQPGAKLHLHAPLRYSLRSLHGQAFFVVKLIRMIWVSFPVPQIKAEPLEEYQYTQLGCAVRPVMGVSPPSCHLVDGCVMPSGLSYQRPQSGMYPAVPQHHLKHPSIRYQVPGILAGSPGHASCMVASHSATSVSTFVSNAYQHTIAGDSIQTAASLFPTLDVSELCSAGAHQKAYGSRASPTTGRSPPARGHQQTYLPVQQQRNVSPVRVKQENLDQAYLDDGLWASLL